MNQVDASTPATVPAYLNKRRVTAAQVKHLCIGINTGKTVLSGPEARALMRHCRVTIRDAATRAGITMKRVRQVRAEGVTSYGMVCDWIEIISGNYGFAAVVANPPQATRKEAA